MASCAPPFVPLENPIHPVAPPLPPLPLPVPTNSAGRMTAREGVQSSSPAAFRVLFSDGVLEIDAGEVVIDPGFSFQKFQFLVGDMVGVSSHQIKLYLLRQKKARSGRSSQEIRRKTPIGEGTDFAALAREKGWAVLAQLKGARKDRRGKGRRDRIGGGAGGGGDGCFAPEKRRMLQPEKAVLRRPVGFPVGASMSSIVPVAKESGAGLVGLFPYEDQRQLQHRKGRQLLATAAAAYYRYADAPHGYDMAGFGCGFALAGASAAAVCEVCSAAAGAMPAPFHWCIHDRVVAEGFRSSAGPIRRPIRSGVQPSA